MGKLIKYNEYTLLVPVRQAPRLSKNGHSLPGLLSLSAQKRSTNASADRCKAHRPSPTKLNGQ